MLELAATSKLCQRGSLSPLFNTPPNALHHPVGHSPLCPALAPKSRHLNYLLTAQYKTNWLRALRRRARTQLPRINHFGHVIFWFLSLLSRSPLKLFILVVVVVVLLAKQTRHEASRESIHAVVWPWRATCHYAPSKSWCQVDFGLWWPIDLTRGGFSSASFSSALRCIISCKLPNYLITTTWSSPWTLNQLDELQSTLASSGWQRKFRCLCSTRCFLLSAHCIPPVLLP